MTQDKYSLLVLRLEDITEDVMEHSWNVPEELFECDDNPLPVGGTTNLHGKIYKLGVNVHFRGEVKTLLRLKCSRCLRQHKSLVESPVEVSFLPIDSINPGTEELQLGADDLDAQLYKEDEVDLFPAVRDQLWLAAPIKPLCSKGCRGLCPECGANLNDENCGCKNVVTDPRFAVLNKLINKDKKQE